MLEVAWLLVVLAAIASFISFVVHVVWSKSFDFSSCSSDGIFPNWLVEHMEREANKYACRSFVSLVAFFLFECGFCLLSGIILFQR